MRLANPNQKGQTTQSVSPSLDLGKYEREGVDISLIRANLALSPTERLRNNKKLLSLIEQTHKKPASKTL